MKSINLLFQLINLLISKPSVVLKSLYHTVRKERFKDKAISEFGKANGLPMVDLNDLFDHPNGTVSPIAFLNGSSKPTDFLLLRKFAQQFRGHYLEIGTWRGESLAVVADACTHCTSVSLGEKELRQLGLGEKHLAVQNFFSKDIPNVLYIKANSLTFDFHSLNQKFDLIFVDGDHSFEGVRSDTRKVFELLKNEDSIIVWHDYASEFEMVNWEVLLGILEGSPKEAHSKIYHVANSLCAIYTNKKLKAYPSDFPNKPNKKFSLSITIDRV
jgi:predicted O-methyltransferase YrrM